MPQQARPACNGALAAHGSTVMCDELDPPSSREHSKRNIPVAGQQLMHLPSSKMMASSSLSDGRQWAIL